MLIHVAFGSLRKPCGALHDEDPLEDHQDTTYVGTRLLHEWLNDRLPSKTVPWIDLVEKGQSVTAACAINSMGSRQNMGINMSIDPCLYFV